MVRVKSIILKTVPGCRGHIYWVSYKNWVSSLLRICHIPHLILKHLWTSTFRQVAEMPVFNKRWSWTRTLAIWLQVLCLSHTMKLPYTVSLSSPPYKVRVSAVLFFHPSFFPLLPFHFSQLHLSCSRLIRFTLCSVTIGKHFMINSQVASKN